MTDTAVSWAQILDDIGLLDEFVEEATRADVEFNKQLADRIATHFTRAAKGTFDFGVRITGTPVLAPYQEFVKPFLRETKIPIIREVTYSDMDLPGKFATRVHALYEQRKELNTKSKTQRLSREEERNLSILNTFVSQANKITEIVRELSDPQQRALRFSLFEMKMSLLEERISE